MATYAQMVSKPPVNPAKYRPSEQVKLIITMIVESRPTETSSWYNADHRRFNDGHRHGLNVVFRALVELETRITDSDDLDRLCGDMIEDAYGSMG